MTKIIAAFHNFANALKKVYKREKAITENNTKIRNRERNKERKEGGVGKTLENRKVNYGKKSGKE